MLLPMLLWIGLYRTALYYPIENHIIATRSAIREYRRLCLVDASAHICVFLITSILSVVPWTVLYYRETGRLIPNSWPSETMIKNSVFLQQAIDRPWYFYLEKLLVLSPVIFIGLCVTATSAFRLFVVDFVGGISNIVGRKSSAADFSNGPKSVREAAIRNSGSHNNHYNIFDYILVLAVSNRQRLHLIVLGSWAFAFLVPLTVLGRLGAGFQTRFILPAVPPLAILACYFVVSPYLKSLAILRYSLVNNSTHTNDNRFFNLTNVLLRVSVVALLLGYSAMHTIYYSILYPTLFADLEYSIIEIIVSILDNVLVAFQDQKSFELFLKLMKHYGLNK